MVVLGQKLVIFPISIFVVSKEGNSTLVSVCSRAGVVFDSDSTH